MLPKRFAPYVFAVLLAGCMTLIVSGITTAINVGVPADFVARWLKAWLPTWAIAFPSLLVVRPFVQKITERLIAPH
jgi:hypothetical protein